MKAAHKLPPEQVATSGAIIVFGRDGKKARGSWFPPEALAAAEVAADMMGMSCLAVANDDVRQLAAKLPKGRLFDSGKAFVPFVQGAVVDALATHLPQDEQLKIRLVGGAGDPGKPSGGGTATGKATAAAPHLPKDWTDIKVGSLVLASEDDEDGWWPCIVTETYPKELRLKWQTFEGYPPFTRAYEQVALFWASPSTATKA
jgi:hypothetical protein